MRKKILSGLIVLCIAVFFTGCSDDSAKPQTSKPVKTEKTQTVSTVKLYGEDLKITQDEFISVYNDVLNNLARSNGNDYGNFRITTDDPQNVEQSQANAIHFYSGERGMISLFKNSGDTPIICAAMITAKTNFKLHEMLPEVEALTQAATQKEHNFNNVMNFIKSSLQNQSSHATNIDGLVVSYNSVGNYLTIIAEDATTGNGFERMVDNIIDTAKMGSYWQK